ncbi:MAG TPA: Clp protease N-terminal domain-containing protein [Pseudonocardiaceae bacterium]
MGGEPLDARLLMQTVQERASDNSDPLVLLETAIGVAAEVGQATDALVERYVGAARAAGSSWTVIGERLGVSKQAARQRFAPRVEVRNLLGNAAEVLATVPRLAACLEVANAAAAEDDSVPSTQHLLLGLLHAGFAANVLDRLDVTRDKVRDASARLFEPAVITAADGQERRVIGDGEADDAVQRARRLAAQRGQFEVRTEHLLFIIALDPGCAARRVLNDLDVDPARIKKELDHCLPPLPRPRRRLGKGRTGRACSFCGCTDPDRPMVAGPGVCICGECVQLSTSILRSQQTSARPS